MPGLLDLLVGSRGVPQGILSPVGDVIDARNRFRGLLHSPDVLQQQLMQQQLMPQPGGTSMVRQPTDMERYSRALLEQSAAFKSLPRELVDKITFWAQKVGAPPDMHLNALTDAVKIKAARRAWESYSPESYAAGIMPPAMQFPRGDPRNAPIPPPEE